MNLFKRIKSPSNDIPSNYWPDLVWWAFGFALLAIFFYSLKLENSEHIGDFWQTLGKLIGFFGTGFLVGFLIGLVFGIPKTYTSSKGEKMRTIKEAILAKLNILSILI